MGTRSEKFKAEEIESDKKIKNQVKKNVDEEYGDYPDISNTVSSCECTGMMYAPPQSEAEFESYQDMFQMQIPKKDSKKPDK